MWKNTSRSILKQKQNNVKPENKILAKPPVQGVDYILPGGFGGMSEYGPAMSEATYYTCLKVLSEAVGKMPIHVRDKEHRIVYNDTEKLLAIRPNESMNSATLWTYLEYCRNHWGNAYLYCDWSGATGRLRSLTALDPVRVRIFIDDVSGDILQKYYYTYTSYSGDSYVIASEDIAHFRNWHLDMQTHLIGIPVRDTLLSAMTAAQAGQQTQNDLYKNGMILGGILNYVGDLSQEKKDMLLENVRKIGTKNKILPLPKDWDLKTINLSMVDAQFLEGRKMNALQIAAAFGVSPNQLNDYSKGSYANSTSQSLAFLTNTLAPIFKQYEDELTYKLLSDAEIKEGLRIDIDEQDMLRSTPDVFTDILCKSVAGSIMTINEARERAGLPPVPKGDQLMTTPGSTTLEKEVVV